MLFCRAFSEVDFTIEAAQHHGRRDRSPPHGTPEGTSFFQDEGSVLLRLERDIVVHFAANRAGADVGRGGIRNDSFNVAAVAGQAVLAVVPKIPDVVDSAAGRNHLYQWTIHAVQSDVPLRESTST